MACTSLVTVNDRVPGKVLLDAVAVPVAVPGWLVQVTTDSVHDPVARKACRVRVSTPDVPELTVRASVAEMAEQPAATVGRVGKFTSARWL
jgi:hypothetical protein